MQFFLCSFVPLTVRFAGSMDRAVDASGGQNKKSRLAALQRTSLQRLSEALLTFEVDEDASRIVLERKEQWDYLEDYHGCLGGFS